MANARDFYKDEPIMGDHFHDTLCKIWYRLFAGSGGSSLPYGADEQVLSYIGTTNNISTIQFKIGGQVVKTRTFTYVNAGAANDDLIATSVDS